MDSDRNLGSGSGSLTHWLRLLTSHVGNLADLLLPYLLTDKEHEDSALPVWWMFLPMYNKGSVNELLL